MRYLSKLSDFMQQEAKQPKKGMEVEADVSCQVCHAYVDTAEYFHVEKLLRWRCPDGHTSFIEEFNL